MKTAIDILDEMIKENIEVRNFDLYGSIRMNVTARYIYERIEEEITRAKEKIQALGDGWIPVIERLPNDNEEYIICTSDRLVTSVAWSTDENNWIVGITNWRTDIFGKITHWMPLPLPPITQ